MDATYYNQMVNFARQHMPHRCLFDPTDVVNEAYLQVGSTSRKELVRTIRAITFKLRGASNFAPEYGTSRKALIETTQVCNTCGKEKPLDDFRTIRYADKPAVHRHNRCKKCVSRLDWKRRKKRMAINPALKAAYDEQCKKNSTKFWKKHSATMIDEERESRRLRCQSYRDQTKTDPVAYAAYLEKARVQGSAYAASVQADP